MKYPIIFITNPIDVKIILPHSVGEHFLFRKATIEEIQIIKHYIAPSFANGMMSQNPYEQIYKFDNETKTVGKLDDLPKSDWRYFVFELQNDTGLLNGNQVDVLRISSDLTNVELKFDLEIYQPEIVKIKHNSLYKTTNKLRLMMFSHIPLMLRDLEDLEIVYAAVSKYFRNDEFLTKALTSYHILQEIPEILDFINLNYFSILEMLVTTKPKDKQPSISKQLKTKTQKILDLDSVDINFGDYFTLTSLNNIWNNLYEYRSCLAHGSHADFIKKFKKINSEKIINDFLKELLKKLFRTYLFHYRRALEIKRDLEYA